MLGELNYAPSPNKKSSLGTAKNFFLKKKWMVNASFVPFFFNKINNKLSYVQILATSTSKKVI